MTDMTNLEICKKLTDILFKPNKDLDLKENMLKLAIEDAYFKYEINDNKMVKMKKEYDDFWIKIYIIRNLFLPHTVKSEKQLFYNKCDIIKSKVIFLIDKFNDEEECYATKVNRALGMFNGSVLDCIKTKRKRNGTYEHKIMCYDWEAEGDYN